MGTVVCLPAAENMGRICGDARDCFPSSSTIQQHFSRSSEQPYQNASKSLEQDIPMDVVSTQKKHISQRDFSNYKNISKKFEQNIVNNAEGLEHVGQSKPGVRGGDSACASSVTSASKARGGASKPQTVVSVVGDSNTSYQLRLAATTMTDAAAAARTTTSTSAQVASPPDRRVTKDDSTLSHPAQATARNGQSAKQGSLTIVRRSSTKKPTHRGAHATDASSALVDDDALDAVDLATENLPAVDTPDACDKAAIRLRCLLRQLQRGEISAELLQKNLNYAAKVLEAVFIDETKDRTESEPDHRTGPTPVSPLRGPVGATKPVPTHQRRRLRTPVWARSVQEPRPKVLSTVVYRRLADEDDELSEVQPDAVPPEVREWLASTFTRQLATTKRRSDEKPKFRSVAHAIRAGIFVDRIYRRVTNTALMQYPADVVRVLKTLDDWSFDVFALNDTGSSQPVKYIGYDLLNRYGIIHKFKVPSVTLETFLSRIEEGYCRYKNPYHNNMHAADVAQTVHYMLCQTGLMNWLSDLEIFATLVAALIHDYEHTGTTNNFHVMSGSEIALLYNDRAVLENHHISAAFSVIKDEECNILQNLSREEFREFRTLVIDMVLATDMSFHFQQLKNMKNLLTLAEPTVEKSKAMSLVLHCCDIAHPAKRWDLHNRWTMSLLEEFFLQGDKERELGLPFSPLCDRNNTLVAESQIGFIEFIVEPSLAVCSDMLETILGPIHSSCKPLTAEGDPVITEESADLAKNGSAASPDQSPRFKIKKPWVTCLGENKKIWKDQAVRDAELRAIQAAETATEE